ncbi:MULTISPECIES: PRTRC system protein E [unclassified Burkholderia]|uniref:PRTRC system protein E n=1 Tax=unclassified Burkholderia TaxID=2613784 RepID=UPI0014244D75|nr:MULTISPECIES: PRTRC system protein E [unclassified Burkholderia]NIE81884.1 PRTRC system protein E [Burkholderia sp. Tr-860]NIF61152.1 PRTRC system protein E [Burkholderia sp. Cy-647]NIF93975.1 PRTRC system protein E [Burkholderia sp. Ax-1720]
MFQALEPLLRSAEKLVLTLAMNGDQISVFLVPAGGKDAMMRQPLILNGTAADLDEGFATAVASFTVAHCSLGEQVAATNAILEANQQTQATKAQKALSNVSKPPTKNTSGDGDADVEEDETEAGTAASSHDTTPAAGEKSAGTDLSSLIL